MISNGRTLKKNRAPHRIIPALMLAFTMIVAGASFYVATPMEASATSTNVATWAELKGAINDGATEITITEDLFAEGDSIEIRGNVTINGDKTIYRGRKDNMDSLFKVTNGGSLTIAGSVKLSGKEYTCAPGTVAKVPGTVTQNKPDPLPKLEDYKQSGTGSVNSVTGSYTITEPGSGAVNNYMLKPGGGPTTLKVDDSGYLYAVVGGVTRYLTYRGQPIFRDVKPSGDCVYLIDSSGNKVTSASSLVAGTEYAFTPQYWTSDTYYLYNDNGNLYHSNTINFSAAAKITANSGSGDVWVIPDASGQDQTYTKEDDAKAALDALIERESTWTVTGNEQTSDPFDEKADAEAAAEATPYAYWTVNGKGRYPTEEEATAAAARGDCSPKQGCDDFEPITKTQFNGTSMDEPKGFFIQVEQGGKAKLAGGTLSDFVTSRDKGETPKYVAPVAVVGGTFDIESGGITNNIVGYIVDDEKANENANAIKMYVKGAAPNAKRTGGERRNSNAGIDGNDKGSGITATAGAVIYTKGAQGTVSGGSISLNRGDTGGIMASGDGTKVTLAGGTDINKNVGVQFGGGTTTENGAWILMTGGTIKENVAWFGGGAVYSTENGVDWLLGKQSKANRQDGWFTMDGGMIEGNTSFTRGGAILADSDGVSLIKGSFKDNMARMLGGAIYVMGDHPDYTYTVYIEKGYVHDNKAVSGGYKNTNPQNPSNVDIDKDNLKLSQKLVAPKDNGCTPVNKLFDGYMDKNSDDTVDGYPPNQKDSTDGTGGGVWLCSYGNTTLDLSNESEFYVNDNTATGSVRSNPISGPGTGGDDLHKDTKNNGSLVITGIDDNDEWYDQNSTKKYTSPDGSTNSVTDTAMRNLINNGTTAGNDSPAGYNPDNYDGVDFYGNLSRRGGALAADGSFVFGKTQDLAQLFAEMSIKKDWTEGTPKQPIVLKVFVETADDKVEFAEVPLSEKGTPASELDVVFDEGGYEGRLMLPAFVEKRDASDKIVGMIPVFDIKLDGEKIDLESVDDLTALAAAIKDDKNRVEFSSEGRKITFEEYIVEDGKLVKTDQFQLSPAKISLDEMDATIKTVKQKQTNGDENTVVTASFPELKFNANVTNDKPAEIEKFVNEAVHKPISLDEVFTYDIVAYVKQDADKLVITDTLVDDLEFVSKATDVKLYDLDKENNHKPTNDVNGDMVNDDASVSGGDVIVNEEVEVDEQVLKKVKINEQTLTVTLANLLEFDDDGNYQKNADNNQLLTPLHGHWVRVSFQAQIKKEYQDKINAGTMKLSDLQNVKIKHDQRYKPDDSIYEGDDKYRPTPNVGNKPVESNENHNGIINTASYAVEVANEAAYRDESNTVTVKPEEPEVEKYVNQAVHRNIMLDEVFTYDIIGYITKDADKVEFTDQLVEDLEFVGTAKDIQVKFLKNNNHKPLYDVEGSAIEGNEDASVASGEWEDVPSDGLTKSIGNDGKLIVTIDDDVTVEDGSVTSREYETVKNLRGRYVKVTFKAQIKKSIQDEINAGTKTLADLASVSVKKDENAPVISDEAHSGIKNDANLKISVANEGKYDLYSNKVTVKPEKPEIEKYINNAVHDYIDLDEEFTYDVLAYVTRNADKFTITDTVVPDLEIVSADSDIKVLDLGPVDNHKVVKDVSGDAGDGNGDATVALKAGDKYTYDDDKEFTVKDITEKATTITVKDKETLTVVFDDGIAADMETGIITRDREDVKNLRGHWVKVTFKAQIKKDLRDEIKAGTKTLDDLTFVTVKAGEKYKPDSSIYTEDGEFRPYPNEGNAPVDSDEDHSGIENTASYSIEVANSGEYKDESNTVTVKPEQPEIEKYVNEAVHDNIALDEVFTYSILAYVTNNADILRIYDQLNSDLEFVEPENIKVYDLGLDDKDEPVQSNHKPVYDADGFKVNDEEDATVAAAGEDITTKEGVTINASDEGALIVVIDDEISQSMDTGEKTRKYTTVKNLRGHWVKVVFKAQIKEELQQKINSGEMSIFDLTSVTIEAKKKFKPEDSIFDEDSERPAPNVGNSPVVSDEDHSGIDNTAAYVIVTNNSGYYEDESNTVTVKPDKPEIEKFIDKIVHRDLHVDKVFTYDVIAYVTNDADRITITDPLVSDLEFVSTADEVKVVDLGKATSENVDHEPNGTAVSAKGTPITGDALNVSIDSDSNTLTVVIDDEITIDEEAGTKTRKYETVKGLRDHWIKVTFEARIESSKAERIKNGESAAKVLEYATIIDTEEEDRDPINVGNDPVRSDEDHTGVKNTASYVIDINNTGEYESKHKDTSNTVTVKPEEPEIEKYVNEAVHDYIDLDEVFTYDIIAYITKDADKVVITDELVDQLQFVSEEGDVKVVDLGEEVNHKVTNDINGKEVNDDASVAEKGENIDNKTVKIEGNILTVTLADETSDDNTVKNLRGHWVKVTFDAKIKDGLTTKDLEYLKIDAEAVEDRAEPNVGNAPVESDESHDGVPNKASYKIYLKNDSDVFEEKYDDETNTVTVKPNEFDISISKQNLQAKALAGAKLEITDDSGKVVDSWISTAEPRDLKLKSGKYELKETAAPEGYSLITTPIKFEVDADGKIKLITKTVDSGGEIGLLDDYHAVLKDAPTPTISKTVSTDEVATRDEVFSYTIEATIGFVPSDSYQIVDKVPSVMEIVNKGNISITANGEKLSKTQISEMLSISGNTLTFSPTKSDLEKWVPCTFKITFDCKFKEDADLSNYDDREVKNVAYALVNGDKVPVPDGDNEAVVKAGFEDKTNPDDKDKSDKNSRTGDDMPIAIMALILTLSMITISTLALRRRRQNQ